MIAVCGYGEHGKGSVSRMVAALTGGRYEKSTSEAAADIVFSQWGKSHYPNVQACWDDRRNFRIQWASIIWDYNQPDGLTLYREMFETNDVLDGVRKAAELRACVSTGLVECSLWVDASKRLPPEGSGSCEIGPNDCDIVIDNNGPESELHHRVRLALRSCNMIPPTVYVSGPYSSDPEVGTRNAIATGDTLMDLGCVPIVPHLSHLWEQTSPKPYDAWIGLDLALLAGCDALVRLDGESRGADLEIEHAERLGIPVVRLTERKRWADELAAAGLTWTPATKSPNGTTTATRSAL